MKYKMEYLVFVVESLKKLVAPAPERKVLQAAVIAKKTGKLTLNTKKC